VGNIIQLATKLKKLKQDDAFRIAMTDELLLKLFNMGIITSTKSLKKAEEVNVSAICRRHLPVIMVRLKMAETMRASVTFIEQGHVRVGPNVVTDPSTLVTRSMEDFVTWVDSSKIKKTLLKYNDQLDDFDLL
jgi:U3 small nucleolar ribonucleoprotein protein IMP3